MKKAYFNQFDSLRFFSIIFIMLYHYQPHRFSGGFLAVNVFFVLSGFLMTRRYEEQIESGKNLPVWRGIGKRLKSIFIPLLLFLVFSLIYLFIFHRDLLTNIQASVVSSLLFINNWQQIIAGQSYFAQYLNPSIFTHLWYLSVYFQLILIFYLYYGFIRQHLSQKQHLITTLLLSLISLLGMIVLFQPGEDPSRVYYGTDTRCFSFLIGSAFAQIERSEFYQSWKKRIHPALTDLLLILLLALITVAFLHMTDKQSFTYYGGMYLFDLVTASVLLLMTQQESFIAKLFTFKPLAWLGKRSFGAYLFYYPVYIIFYAHAQEQNIFTQSIFLQICLVFLLAMCLHDLILDRKLEQWIFTHLNFNQLGERRSQATLKNSRLLASLGLLLAAAMILWSAPTENTAALAEQEAVKTAQENAKRNESNQEKIDVKESQVDEQTEAKDDDKEVKEAFEEYKTSLNDTQVSYYDSISEEEAYFSFQTPVSFVGDSITLGASDAIYTFFPKSIVTANVGLQFEDAQANIEQLKSNGQLHKNLVVALGSNGDFTKELLDSLVQSVGEDHNIYFVTTHVNRPWRDNVNQVYTDYVESNKNKNIHLIDFNQHFQNTEDASTWLEQDGVHFNQTGMLQWLSFIVEQLYQDAS